MTHPAEDLLRQAAQHHREGRRGEAIELLRQALAAKPDAAEAWYELGYLLKAEGRYEEAMDAYAEAIAHGMPRPEEAHLNRAVICSDHLRRDAEAEAELQAALALAPDYVPALLNLGNLHEERGGREGARECYERVLANAGRGDRATRELCYEALARLSGIDPPATADDPRLKQLAEAAVAIQGNRRVRTNLWFALGRAHERLDSYEAAFDAFHKANRWLMRMGGRTYDRGHAERLVDAQIAAFPAPAADAPLPEGGAEPLFICGMFRSGSTLLEQVLAAHPQVTAGGELNYLLRLAAERLAPYPQSMATRDPAQDAELAAGYRAHLAGLFPEGTGGRYITDKRPDNFQLIGLIKRLFPRAKIVHTRRHPMDTGLSLFSHHLDPRVAGYSTDLRDIGHHYGQYQRLMAHWRALYPDTLFDFDYDAFVRAPRPTLEPLLSFLGLDWDERCLSFHELRNTVKTASYWQIRQPLSDRASGRWRRYGALLDPLRQALVDAGVAVGQA